MGLKPAYKQTEVGVIPGDWATETLRSLVRHHNSGIYKKRELYGRGCNIVGVSDLYDIHHVDGQVFARVPISDQERAKYTLEPGDLLYGESSLVREGIARTVYVTARGAGTAFAWHTRRYSIDQNALLSAYLYYYLQTRPARKHMMDQCIQTAITGINTVAYFACPVPMPPLPEQRAIAAALGDVDPLIGSLEQLIAKKRDLKQAAMHQLLTGQQRLPGFHGEWEVVRFADLADKNIQWSITGGPFGSNLKASDYAPEGVRIIQLQNIGDGAFNDDYAIFTTPRKADELISCNIYPGEIILSKMGDPVARACFVPLSDSRYLMASDGIRLVVDAKRFDKQFVHAFINSIYFRKKAIEASTGSTRQRVGLEDLKRLPFSAPPLDEQTAIAGVLSDMDAEFAALEARRDKTRALKQGMMRELLTGRTRLV